MSNENTKGKLAFIQKQFLCCVAICTFTWANVLDNLNWDTQSALIALTVDFELVVKLPIKISYQIAFLKFVIRQLEEQGIEVNDKIYEALGRLVVSTEQPDCFKHYLLDNGQIITLKESSSIVSEGTTGLRSWQASLALSEWCLNHKAKLKHKTVLELGSGIGLTGIIVALNCEPKEIYLTDCHSSVLQRLCDNIQTNLGEEHTDRLENCSKLIDTLLSKTYKSGTAVTVIRLLWEDITESVSGFINPDVLLAADVVYDSFLFSPLISAVSNFLKGSAAKELIIACTERNKLTLEEFLALLEDHNLCYTELDQVPQKNFVWSTQCPVRIFSIRSAAAVS